MTRRGFLETVAALSLAGPALAGTGPAPVRVSGPAVVESLPLLVMSRAGGLPEISRPVAFTPWNSPDQMRAMIATAAVDAVLVATASACTLGNKGVPTSVTALFSSPIWLVCADENLARLSDLRGREVLLCFGPGEMPDLLLRVLTDRAGVRFTPRHVGSALEAANLLLLGRGECALLSEPAASLVVHRSQSRTGSARPGLAKRLDIRDAWRDAFPGHPELAQGALALVGPLASDASARKALRESYRRAAAWVRTNPREAASLADREFPALGAQAVDGVLPGSDIRLVEGPTGRACARFLLGLLHEMSPESVGGSPPGPGFLEADA